MSDELGDKIMPLPEPIQRIDALFKKATPGEWGWCNVEDEDGNDVPDFCIYAKPGPAAAIFNVYNDGEPEAKYNREIVIELHNNWPDIKAHIEKLESIIARAKAATEGAK